MVLDCKQQLIAEIENYLRIAAAKGVVRYGMHCQDEAMVTCFTPSPTNPNHVHFCRRRAGRLCARGSRAQGKQRPA
jgi:hypothetical protein